MWRMLAPTNARLHVNCIFILFSFPRFKMPHTMKRIEQKKRKWANNSLQAILLNIVSFGFRYTHFLFFFFCSSLTKHSSQLKFIFHNENLFLPQVYNYSNENVWQIESICRPVSEWQESRRKENTKKNVLAKENVTEKNKWIVSMENERKSTEKNKKIFHSKKQ